MTLTLLSFTELVVCLYLPIFRPLAAIFLKYPLFSLFTIEKHKLQNLPCGKIGQGHSRVIILTNYDEQEFPMLQIKLRGNRPAGSGEDF